MCGDWDADDDLGLNDRNDEAMNLPHFWPNYPLFYNAAMLGNEWRVGGNTDGTILSSSNLSGDQWMADMFVSEDYTSGRIRHRNLERIADCTYWSELADEGVNPTQVAFACIMYNFLVVLLLRKFHILTTLRITILSRITTPNLP